ncbi:diguanylate cyclase [Rheinheimera sp. 1928-s]|uniref:diguanylate cyclase domain-containing protein n=1 Tax=Rheinheimera sp. 1928-s TaxID=3033803 RepID=UPI0026100F7B|nr:diguanylate cyclase [Rheinheimera sp. 1928-s]MDF3125710.1 diguanylate cyclase [Rheinheimera sp. 1928-s]
MKNLLLCILSLYCATVQASSAPVRFGILTHYDIHEAKQHYAALQSFLSAQMTPEQVQLVVIEPANLELTDIQTKTDFLLTDPYHYLQLKAKGDLPTPLLSQVTLTASGQFELSGGVILCLASNPLCDLSQISQARIAATGPFSLLGYVAQLKELQRMRLSLNPHLLHHLTSDKAVVAAVKNKQMDIGFVRSGVLETMIRQGSIGREEMKVLNTQALAELPVQSSTRLYPDWPVLVMPGVPSALSNRMMASLLQWEKQARASGLSQAFGVAADYQSVEHSLQALALPPYQDTGVHSYLHSWSDHKGVLFFVALLLAFILVLYIAFRQRNTQLRLTNDKLQQLNQKLMLQKNQMSTVFNNTVHVLLFGLDMQGRIVHFNDNALKLLHVTEDSLQGQFLIDWLPDPGQRSTLQSAMQCLQDKPHEAVVLSLKIQLANGKELYLDSDLFHLPGAPADGSDFVLLCTDVSRRHWIEKRLQKSFKRLDQLIERSPSVIYAFDPVTMRLNYISPNCFTMYLKSSMEIMRMANWWDLSVGPDDKQLIAQKFMDWVGAGYPGVLKYSCTQERNVANSGLYAEESQQKHQQICIENQLCALRDEHGQVTEVIGSQLDISERHHAQMKQELAASVFIQAREGIFITDATGTILDLNHSFCRITGYTETEALGCHLALLGASQSDKLYFEALWQELSRAGFWEGEIQGKRKNGESIVLALTISVVQDVQHQAVHYVALFSDITVQKAQEDKLRFIAHFDALTGLPNRLLLKDRIAQNMALAKRRKQLMAVIFIDIDGFKAVNDSLGHEAGDYLLVELANRMRCVMRENDTLARLGGDEFIALLTELPGEAECIPLIERLLYSASKPFELHAQQARVSASIGITFYPQKKPVDDATLIRQADMAMYQAKHSGKNQYAIFASSDKEMVG